MPTPVNNKTIAALYIRVSTEEQVEGFSLDAQRDALVDYCQKNQLGVFKIYMDAGRSGKSIEGRPSLQQLLDDATNNCFQIVICLRLNRLSRNLSDLLYVVELFDKFDISLHSLTEQLQTETPVGKFVLQMMGATSQLEREQISQNVRLGMQERSKQGKWNSGNQVLGYHWHSDPNDPRLSYVKVIPKEAELVNYIFIMYTHGHGLKAISNQLNQKGHLTKRGKSFQSNSVRGILSNYNYIGKITYHTNSLKRDRQIIDGEHEPLISLELWEKVHNLLSQRSRPPNKLISHHFLLSGLLKCPVCGHSMVPAHVNRKRKNEQKSTSLYYICGRYANYGSTVCKANHIRTDIAEDWVSNQIQLFLTQPSIADRLIYEINLKREKQKAPYQQKLKKVYSQIKALKDRNLRCYELFEEGHINSHTLKDRLGDLQNQTKLLEQEREKLLFLIKNLPVKLLPKESLRQALNDLDMLKSASLDQQKALFQSLIDTITVPINRDITKAIINGKAALLDLSIPPILVAGGS